MPATAAVFGISLHQGTFIEEVTREAKVETATKRGSNGRTVLVAPYDQMNSFTVKGFGETDVAVGIGESGVEGLTGGVTIIKSFKQSDKNNEVNGWEYSGDHYPHAAAMDTEP